MYAPFLRLQLDYFTCFEHWLYGYNAKKPDLDYRFVENDGVLHPKRKGCAGNQRILPSVLEPHSSLSEHLCDVRITCLLPL